MVETNFNKHFALSDVGKARSNNEDYFLADDDLNLYILADGIGGHNYGEVASKKACEVILEKFKQIIALTPAMDLETAYSAMKFAIYSANRTIYQMTLDNPDLEGMGTTIVVFYKHDAHVIIGHVGDSRCYKMAPILAKLTEDHTIFVAKSPKSRSFRSKHYLTRSVGLKEFVEPSIVCIPHNHNTQYMLCSDGLSDYLEEHKIEQILNDQASLEAKANKLLSAALQTAAKDNITFILISPDDVKN